VVTGNVSEMFVSFQGEGLLAGQRQLFLRMAGCNLRCRYCDTPESLSPTRHCMVRDGRHPAHQLKNPVEVASVTSEVKALRSRQPAVQALAITGGEPIIQAAFLDELLRALKGEIPVLLETNGTRPELLDQLMPLVDIVSLDFKLPSNSGERELWEDHVSCLRVATSRAGAQVYVKVLVDEATDPGEIARAAGIVARVSTRVPLFLQPIVLNGSRGSDLPIERLEEFHNMAANCHRDVRFLPQIHKLMRWK